MNHTLNSSLTRNSLKEQEVITRSNFLFSNKNRKKFAMVSRDLESRMNLNEKQKEIYSVSSRSYVDINSV